MTEDLKKVLVLLKRVTNPWLAIGDRVGLRHRPYVLRVRRGGAFEIRPRTGDLFGFYEIILRGDYLSSGQTLVPGETVIDIGANIGCFSLLAARIVGPTGRVIAVEPDASSYRQLLRNIALSRLSNVIPLNLAVGDQEGTATLHSTPNRLFSSIFSSVNGRTIAGQPQAVTVTTLDALMTEHRVDRCAYLKLDCEGAEHQILTSLSVETASRVRQITMELHEVQGFSGANLHATIEKLGYAQVGTSALPFYRRY